MGGARKTTWVHHFPFQACNFTNYSFARSGNDSCNRENKKWIEHQRVPYRPALQLSSGSTQQNPANIDFQETASPRILPDFANLGRAKKLSLMRLHVDPVSQTCTVSANCPLSLVKYHFAVLDRFCEIVGTTKWNWNKTSFETVSKLFWNYYVSVSFRCAYSLMRDDCWQEKVGVNRCWCKPKISCNTRTLYFNILKCYLDNI